ncbi:hypothetical protein BJ095_11279 [Ureibacillus chungkukjangi]|uniref:Uncharacterized protein n=1 Tax=Ureibacillus chungkukjangi TaxID=1202712 RepID=A0A318TSX0_9BACL|nr:hypothetical protein BJ095_11279 [Ureibacillus chungkukjangi]
MSFIGVMKDSMEKNSKKSVFHKSDERQFEKGVKEKCLS